MAQTRQNRRELPYADLGYYGNMFQRLVFEAVSVPLLVDHETTRNHILPRG